MQVITFLIDNVGTEDANRIYSSAYFRITSLVQEVGGKVVGFVSEDKGDCNHSAFNWNLEDDGWYCLGCGEKMPNTPEVEDGEETTG